MNPAYITGNSSLISLLWAINLITDNNNTEIDLYDLNLIHIKYN